MPDLMEAYAWMGAHTVSYLQVLCLIVALFVVWVYALNQKPSVRREMQMDELKKEDSAVADAIHEGLFEAYCANTISRHRYNHEMKRLGNLLNLPDLFPKIRWTHPQALKAEQRRLKAALLRRLPPEKVQAAMAKAHQPKPKIVGNGKLNLLIRSS